MKTLVYVMIFGLIFGCICNKELKIENQKKLKMTVVIFSDNINPDSEWANDVLIKDSVINVKEAIIDLYYIHTIADFPYYLPTNNFFRDSIKESECDIKKYPSQVTCYEYDSINRVIKMSIDGSGVFGTWMYKYDNLNRLIEIKDGPSVYTMHYLGNLNLLTEVIYKRDNIYRGLEIKYQK